MRTRSQFLLVGATSSHRVAVVAPGRQFPSAHGGDIDLIVANHPVNFDGQLPADRRFPVDG